MQPIPERNIKTNLNSKGGNILHFISLGKHIYLRAFYYFVMLPNRLQNFYSKNSSIIIILTPCQRGGKTTAERFCILVNFKVFNKQIEINSLFLFYFRSPDPNRLYRIDIMVILMTTDKYFDTDL